MIYCIVPRGLAGQLHEVLRHHFADDAGVEVVVERRAAERRSGERRARGKGTPPQGLGERRRAGRRAGRRRAATVEVEYPAGALPRRARRHRSQLQFVERARPAGEDAEDLDTARLVARIKAGEGELFETLYTRYFDRVYSYLRLALDDHHEAEDMAQDVFVDVLRALPRYEARSVPFRAWLFRVARNRSINLLRRRARLELEEPASIEGRIEENGEGAGAPEADGLEALPADPAAMADGLEAISWITDPDLQIFVERMPPAQRQLIALRYLMGLDLAEIAETMGRDPAAIRQMHRRALEFLGERLTKVRERLSRAGDGGRRQASRTITKQAWVVRHRKFIL